MQTLCFFLRSAPEAVESCSAPGSAPGAPSFSSHVPLGRGRQRLSSGQTEMKQKPRQNRAARLRGGSSQIKPPPLCLGLDSEGLPGLDLLLLPQLEKSSSPSDGSWSEWGLGTILDKQVCANRIKAVKLYQFGFRDYLS